MAGQSRRIYNQFRSVSGQVSSQEQRRPPQLEEVRSSTEIRLWLPQIQEEIEVCLQRAQDPAQSTYQAADFQRRARQLQDYYRACRCRLQELDGSETTSSSDPIPVTVTHHVSTTAVSEGPQESLQDDELSHSSLEEVSSESICGQLVAAAAVAVRGSFESCTKSCSD
ncbi:uncharacterized protein LOC119433831 isoform X1 [Dermacentor silvarum]|uniref:uncharacterized protein LOC119433831 isoform X1 n=1 Tax=Dermacentor silvarum TaxID=543639 RepID=UPI00189A1C54|nr:uncharacterized protein LOC119433831 isoform X1 [Dermacentor silvarum]